jgi:hypothetical protein
VAPLVEFFFYIDDLESALPPLALSGFAFRLKAVVSSASICSVFRRSLMRRSFLLSASLFFAFSLPLRPIVEARQITGDLSLSSVTVTDVADFTNQTADDEVALAQDDSDETRQLLFVYLQLSVFEPLSFSAAFPAVCRSPGNTAKRSTVLNL